eukprot:2763978-Prymnesium_polylepis.2
MSGEYDFQQKDDNLQPRGLHHCRPTQRGEPAECHWQGRDAIQTHGGQPPPDDQLDPISW